MFDHKDKKHQLRMDHEIDGHIGRLHQGLLHKHLQDLHKKLRQPSMGSDEEETGETPAEERSEQEQEGGMPGEGEVAPMDHAHILREMLDPGEGEHEDEKAHEMERQASMEPQKSAMRGPGEDHAQHEPVMEEEHDSEPKHMKKHKKHPFGAM